MHTNTFFSKPLVAIFHLFSVLEVGEGDNNGSAMQCNGEKYIREMKM